MKFSPLVPLALVLWAAPAIRAEETPDKPVSTGPQLDGNFNKVILDTGTVGKEGDKFVSTLKDPMELAVAADGRVFYAERAGHVKMWTPKNHATVVIGWLKLENYEETK